jgi:hypothetical protein
MNGMKRPVLTRRVLACLTAVLPAVPLSLAAISPVSARVFGGADPDQSQAGGTATITGSVEWTMFYPFGDTGGDTQTGTFTVSGESSDSDPYSFTGNSQYQDTDNTNYSISPGPGCTSTIEGSASDSGTLPDQAQDAAGGAFYIWITSNSGGPVTFDVGLPGVSEQTTTSGCDPGTATIPIEFQPGCTAPGSFPGELAADTITVDCSGGTTSTGTYSVTGTLTINPCGGTDAISHPQESQAPAASACGLTITSPPDSTTIAISDPNYIDGAQIGPNDRAPALDTLKLKVAGTSIGCTGPVTVNGVAATSGDDWTADIPLMALATGGVGQVTLTAKASGCSDATSTVTLINLEITNPTEDEDEPIANLGDGGAPAMPTLDASVSATGYSGDTSGVSFGWTLDIRDETVARPEPGHWSPDAATITGSTTGTGQAWQPGNDQIVGGVARLTVTASLPGVADTVTSFPRWIDVTGSPLGKAPVLAYLQQSADAQYADTISQIFCVESQWQQFSDSDRNGDPPNPPQPPIPNVPDDWTPNPGPGQPLYGHPAGIGVAQYDPEEGTAPLDAYWNWQTNVEYGIFVFNQKLEAARGLAGQEQARLESRRNRAIAIARKNRKKEHRTGAPDVPRLITVPQLTDEEILWQAVRLYNGHNEFHFNADYIVSANGLNVDLVSTDTSLPRDVWVGGGDLFSGHGLPGVPPSPAGYWLGSGDHSHRMEWKKVSAYDEEVRVCPNKP